MRSPAQDRGAHSNLRHALTTHRGYYAEHERYSATTNQLETWAPALDWTHSDAARDGVLPAAPGPGR